MELGRSKGLKALVLFQLKTGWQFLLLDQLQQLDGWPTASPFHHKIQIFVGGAFAQEPVAHSTTHHAEMQTMGHGNGRQPVHPLLGSAAGVHYGLPGFRTAVTSPAQGDDWFSKFKRWRLAKAVRLIKELEIYRNFVPADLIRQWLIGIQPGIAPLRQRPSQQAEFVLWLPPDWQPTAAQQRRLCRVLGRRQERTGAAVVSCDDWLPLHQESGVAQKGQLDPLLDRATEQRILADSTQRVDQFVSPLDPKLG